LRRMREVTAAAEEHTAFPKASALPLASSSSMMSELRTTKLSLDSCSSCVPPETLLGAS